MEFLAPYHPVIVHAPVALIITAAVFELVGRAADLEWWRKAAFALLVIGVLGAGIAVLSGKEAGELAEKQGVPEEAVDAHEDIAVLTWWLGLAAVVTRALASRVAAARSFLPGIALLLQLAVAVTVGVAAYRGGRLVYEHGAAVRIHGHLARPGP